MRSCLLLSLSIILTCCTPKWDAELLIGSWKTASWIEQGSRRTVDQGMDFSFDADQRYIIDYGSRKEQGRYWIDQDYLYTEADGQSSKRVLLIELNSDSLVMDMNRAGVLERITLVKN